MFPVGSPGPRKGRGYRPPSGVPGSSPGLGARPSSLALAWLKEKMRQAGTQALLGRQRASPWGVWRLLGPQMLRGTSLACQGDGFCRQLPCRLTQSWPCAYTWAKAVPPDPRTKRVGPSGSGELLMVAARERCYDSKGFMMQARGRRAVLSNHLMSQLGRGSCQRVFSRDPRGWPSPYAAQRAWDLAALGPAAKSAIDGRGWGETHGWETDRQRSPSSPISSLGGLGQTGSLILPIQQVVKSRAAFYGHWEII